VLWILFVPETVQVELINVSAFCGIWGAFGGCLGGV
jgi:hypothetical protein